MAEKRRLPVLQSSGAGESDEPRPPWQWVGFGVVLDFAAWLPLAYVAELLKAHLAPSIAGALLFAVVPLAAGSFGGGFVVGRFGDRVGARVGAFAGGSTGLATGGLSWTPFVAVALLGLFGGLGGRFGARGRPR
jgi:hypothetical protein